MLALEVKSLRMITSRQDEFKKIHTQITIKVRSRFRGVYEFDDLI